MMIVSRFEKKSLPTKILSSFALLAQPHQNIANRVISKLLIQTRGPIPTYILLNLLAYYGHSISNMVYMPQVFHFPD